LREEFTTTVGEPLGAGQMIHDPQQKYRMLVMVSRQAHCLNYLLHRVRGVSVHARTPLADPAGVITHRLGVFEPIGWLIEDWDPARASWLRPKRAWSPFSTT
jgi:hypothetical protein